MMLHADLLGDLAKRAVARLRGAARAHVSFRPGLGCGCAVRGTAYPPQSTAVTKLVMSFDERCDNQKSA